MWSTDWWKWWNFVHYVDHNKVDDIVELADLTRAILVDKRLPAIPTINCPLAVQQVIAACLTYDQERRPRSKDIFDQLRAAKKAQPRATWVAIPEFGPR